MGPIPLKLLTDLESDGWKYLMDAERVAKMIPNVSGIYCFVRYDILNDLTEVIYVGKSKDFSVRLKPWHSIENRFDKIYGFTFCYIKPADNFDELEKEYIRKFTPMFNIQHNPKITRKIIYEYGQGGSLV